MSQYKGTCLVTGSAGFIGSHLAMSLLEQGYEVVGIDNYFSGHHEYTRILSRFSGFNFFEKSVAETSVISKIKKDFPELSVIFHLAAIVSVPYSVNHENETMKINWLASKSLLHESHGLGLERFVFAGSAAEYGKESRLPILEDYATKHSGQLSPYGRSKFLATKAVASSPIGVSLRCFNIYGPRQDPNSPYSGVISRFLAVSMSGRPLTIYGDGKQSRDFIYVSDVVAAYLLAAGIGPTCLPPGVYNVGTGKKVTILELQNEIATLSRNKEKVILMPPRDGDILHSVANIDKLVSLGNWRPKVNLKNGLAMTSEWLKYAAERCA